MSITTAATSARADLLRLDADTRKLLLRTYRPIQDRLLRELDDLLRVIADAQRRGTPIRRSWLLRQERYRTLLADVAREIQQFAVLTGDIVTTAQQRAIELGLTSAVDLIDASLGERPPGSIMVGVTRLPTQAIVALVDNKPLQALLESFGVDAAARTREILADALALGQNPRVVRAAVRKALGTSAVRSLTIARTEMLRAHRTASLETYRANSTVVRRWRWLCAKQTRTCAMCWALDGEEFDLDEPFASHVNCRCTTVPVTATWEEFGFRGIAERPQPRTGAEVFADLDADTQRQILGPGKYELYRTGQIQLRDLVANTRSQAWGAGRREKTLREVTG
jgi:SPP1 gp7 family putative phage head morphogenesis protein